MLEDSILILGPSPLSSNLLSSRLELTNLHLHNSSTRTIDTSAITKGSHGEGFPNVVVPKITYAGEK